MRPDYTDGQRAELDDLGVSCDYSVPGLSRLDQKEFTKRTGITMARTLPTLGQIPCCTCSNALPVLGYATWIVCCVLCLRWQVLLQSSASRFLQ